MKYTIIVYEQETSKLTKDLFQQGAYRALASVRHLNAANPTRTTVPPISIAPRLIMQIVTHSIIFTVYNCYSQDG